MIFVRGLTILLNTNAGFLNTEDIRKFWHNAFKID